MARWGYSGLSTYEDYLGDPEEYRDADRTVVLDEEDRADG